MSWVQRSLWNLLLSVRFAQCFVQAFVSACFYQEPLCSVCGLLQTLASARIRGGSFCLMVLNRTERRNGHERSNCSLLPTADSFPQSLLFLMPPSPPRRTASPEQYTLSPLSCKVFSPSRNGYDRQASLYLFQKKISFCTVSSFSSGLESIQSVITLIFNHERCSWMHIWSNKT